MDAGGTHPRVAVIVPSYNSGKFLAETLDSVLSQSFADWECIVVDDGSTDDSIQVAARFTAADDRFRLVRQENAGVSAARNAGVAAASPKVAFLAFLDSDDTWIPDALELLVTALDSHQHAAGVYGLAEYMDENSDPIRPGAHPAVQRDRRVLGRFDLTGVPPAAPSTFSTLIVSGTIWPPAVGLYRRWVVDVVGGFDPEQHNSEDWDLYLRMSRHGPLFPVDRQIAWYRRHSDNKSSCPETMAYHYARVRWKAWYSSDNTPAQRREGARVWRRLAARWVYWSLAAAFHALCDRRLRDATQALVAAAAFGRHLVTHPPEPDARVVAYIVRYVVARSAGAGSPPP